MTRLAILLLGAMLVGCDMVNAPDQVTDYVKDYLPASASSRYACTKYVQWPDQVIEVDSGSFCPYSDSGSYYPVLVRATWTGTNSACSVVGEHGNTGESQVVGGVAGIRRYFGCYRKPIAHPVPVVTECADCGWEK